MFRVEPSSKNSIFKPLLSIFLTIAGLSLYSTRSPTLIDGNLTDNVTIPFQLPCLGSYFVGLNDSMTLAPVNLDSILTVLLAILPNDYLILSGIFLFYPKYF